MEVSEIKREEREIEIGFYGEFVVLTENLVKRLNAYTTIPLSIDELLENFDHSFDFFNTVLHDKIDGKALLEDEEEVEFWCTFARDLCKTSGEFYSGSTIHAFVSFTNRGRYYEINVITGPDEGFYSIIYVKKQGIKDKLLGIWRRLNPLD